MQSNPIFFRLQLLRIIIAVVVVSFITKLSRLVPPIEAMNLSEYTHGFLLQLFDPQLRLLPLVVAAVLGIVLAGLAVRRRISIQKAFLIHALVGVIGFFALRGMESFFIQSSSPTPRDFLFYKIESDLIFIGLFYLVSFLSTFAYWTRAEFVTVEVLAIVIGMVWLLSGHEGFQSDAPKELNAIAWQLAAEPYRVLVWTGLAISVFLGTYLSLSHERPLVTRPMLTRHKGKLRPVSLALPPLLFLVLLAIGQLIIRHYETNIGQQAEGVGMTNGKEDDSPLTFSNGGVGKTRQLAALLRFETDYPEDPWSPMLYIREGALSKYNGKEIVVGPPIYDDDVPRGRPEQTYLAMEKKLGVAPEVRREVTTSIYLLAKHQSPFAIDFPLSLRPIKNPDSQRFNYTYQALSLAPITKLDELLGEEVGEFDWPKEKLDYYLTAPGTKSGQHLDSANTSADDTLDQYHEDLRYREVADELTKGFVTPVEKARAIVNYLSKTSVYTRTPGHQLPPNGDPVAPYLFAEKKRGYCVHFAHAAVYLFRLSGIPARIGTGYLTDLTYAKDGHVLLHLGDRHAWPEIYVRGHGWMVVDIQPAEAENEQVIIPDEKILEDLMSKIDPAELLTSQTPTAPEDQPKESLLTKVVSKETGQWILLSLFSVFVGLKLWLRLSWKLARTDAQRIARSYRAFASVAADMGLFRNPAETRIEFANRVFQERQLQSSAMTKLNELRAYRDQRSFAVDDFSQALRELTSSFKGMGGVVRRIVLWLSPLSLMRLGRW